MKISVLNKNTIGRKFILATAASFLAYSCSNVDNNTNMWESKMGVEHLPKGNKPPFAGGRLMQGNKPLDTNFENVLINEKDRPKNLSLPIEIHGAWYEEGGNKKSFGKVNGLLKKKVAKSEGLWISPMLPAERTELTEMEPNSKFVFECIELYAESENFKTILEICAKYKLPLDVVLIGVNFGGGPIAVDIFEKVKKLFSEKVEVGMKLVLVNSPIYVELDSLDPIKTPALTISSSFIPSYMCERVVNELKELNLNERCLMSIAGIGGASDFRDLIRGNDILNELKIFIPNINMILPIILLNYNEKITNTLKESGALQGSGIYTKEQLFGNIKKECRKEIKGYTHFW